MSRLTWVQSPSAIHTDARHQFVPEMVPPDTKATIVVFAARNYLTAEWPMSHGSSTCMLQVWSDDIEWLKRLAEQAIFGHIVHNPAQPLLPLGAVEEHLARVATSQAEHEQSLAAMQRVVDGLPKHCAACEHREHDGQVCGKAMRDDGSRFAEPNGQGGANCNCDLRV